jgi:teichuronic acid biosynthesis glycosyltransferase TuaH
MLPKEDAESLQRTGRVHLTGAVPYAEVPEYMRAFDVCITPHRMTLFTESLNPIKLWEYLAAGKPIVSTDVAGFRGLSGAGTHRTVRRSFPESVLGVAAGAGRSEREAQGGGAEAFLGDEAGRRGGGDR